MIMTTLIMLIILIIMLKRYIKNTRRMRFYICGEKLVKQEYESNNYSLVN